MNKQTSSKSHQDLKEECAPVFYKEIEKFFAKGMLVLIAEELDIIQAALVIQNNDSEQLQKWIALGLVVRVNDEHAIKWSQSNEPLMAITAVPWVLVQELNDRN